MFDSESLHDIPLNSESVTYMRNFVEWLKQTSNAHMMGRYYNETRTIGWNLDDMDRYYNETRIPRPSQLQQEIYKEKTRRGKEEDLMEYLRSLPGVRAREKYWLYKTHLKRCYPPRITPMSLPEFKHKLEIALSTIQ
jgi:hypothetical protein